MRRPIHILSIVATLGLAMSAPARAEDLSDGTGSLPGSAWGSLGLELGFLSTEAALTTPIAPALAMPTDVSGMFGQLRFKTGAYLRVTRYGTEVGLEGSFALGFASAGAIDPSAQGIWMIDTWGGVNAALFRIDPMHLALKVVGGVGLDQDAAYMYAGGRLSLEPSAAFALELGYTFRSGDTNGEDVTLKDHAMTATVVLRDLGLTLGGEYRLGSARRYQRPAPGATAVEVIQKDQLWKGDYSAFIFSVGYSWF